MCGDIWLTSMPIVECRSPTPLCSTMNEPIEVDPEPLSRLQGLLEVAFKNETQTPDEILGLIPSLTIMVASLLKMELPAALCSSAINIQSAKSCTTDHGPHWTTKEIFKAPIPPRVWLNNLEITVKQKWFAHGTDIASICHPTVSTLPSALGCALLVLYCGCCGTKGGVEESQVLDFRSSARCGGV